MATKNQTRAASQSAVFLLLLGGIFVLLNVLGVFVNLRTDWTGRELFSLSNGSKSLVSRLKDRMEITAYFSGDLPAPHNATERYVRDLLTEYRDASHHNIALKFVNPVEETQKQAADRDGVRLTADQQLDGDSFGIYRGYRGIAFSYNGEIRAIPQIDDTEGLEYKITQIIKELSGDKAKIGLLIGKNEEPPQNPMAAMQGQRPPPGGPHLDALKGYLSLYDVQEVKADKEIPKELKALVIVQPDQAFTDPELRYIDQYVMHGGSLAVFGGALKVDFGQGMPSTATPVDTGLNKLLEKWGVTLQNKIIADKQCSMAPVVKEIAGLGRAMVRMPYPLFPVITFEENQRKHPVLFRLDQTLLPYATPLALNDNLKGDKQVTKTVLAQSTKNSWLLEGASIDVKTREGWELPRTYQSYPVGFALEGNLPSAFAPGAMSSVDSGDSGTASSIKAPARSEKPVHVLVFGSGYFLRDEFLPPSQDRELPGGRAALVLNAIDWLTQDSDLIEIRAKSVEDPTLEVPQEVKVAEATIQEAIKERDEDKAKKAVEEGKAGVAAWDKKKTTYRWANTLGLPLALALFGVLRWRVRKATRANLKL